MDTLGIRRAAAEQALPHPQPARTTAAGEARSVPAEYGLTRLIVLHLAPGAIFTALVALAAPVLKSRGIDPIFVLFGGIGLILMPFELGYLALQARRTTGSWSPLGAVEYKNRLPRGRLVLLAGGLAAWFLLILVISMAFLDKWLIENVFSWMPETLRQFGMMDDAGGPVSGGAIVAFLAVAVAFNGIAGPITEELYFRGHLLPRLERYGRWAPVINTVLFGIYHFFSPWRYPAIILGFLPITWMAWRSRSVLVSIAAHMAINMVTVLLILAAILASSS